MKSHSKTSDERDRPMLLIGPHLRPNHSNPGGATVSYASLLLLLAEHNIVFQSINTQMYSGALATSRNWFYVLRKYFHLIWHSDTVFINVSSNGLRYLAPFLTIITHGLAKRMIIRPFGGNYLQLYQTMNYVEKYLHRATVLRADILFLQTRELCDAFAQIATKVVHLSTSRTRPASKGREKSNSYRKRYVYVGHIKSSKGIAEILQAATELDESYTIHIYGPIVEPDLAFLRDDPDIYCGMITGDVYKVLAKYDVLILPTYYEGEGYPGVIIEAFAMGLPVISTNWKCIPEIVDQGQTGFLIEPRSAQALKEAIIQINKSNYPKMSEAAHASFLRHYDSRIVGKKMLDTIRSIP
ncbi:MAG: glycosyltransferase [Saprospiraceae bacterium]|nr:glycosyltransferase [Saprospiraceae bacterium]